MQVKTGFFWLAAPAEGKIDLNHVWAPFPLIGCTSLT
jgi:hypothetical protein